MPSWLVEARVHLVLLSTSQVRELVDEHVWEEHCLGHEADADLDIPAVKPRQLCLVAFLPHILDTRAAGRQALIKVRNFISHCWSTGAFVRYTNGAHEYLDASCVEPLELCPSWNLAGKACTAAARYPVRATKPFAHA